MIEMLVFDRRGRELMFGVSGRYIYIPYARTTFGRGEEKCEYFFDRLKGVGVE